MREVPVPTVFAAYLLRRPLMLLAACLVVLQAFLAGVATAHAAAIEIADPFGVICHGADGGANPADPPDAGKVWHLCCTFCLSSAPALAPPDAPAVALIAARRAEPHRLLERI